MPRLTTRERISAQTIAEIKAARVKLGMSMNRLAEKAGLSVSMISFVERGLRNPTLDTLLRISEALNLDLWRVLKTATEIVEK